MAFGMSPFPLQFGSRDAAGDPTALTQYNFDARLTALGLTQAGTGTTWGETGKAATPLYAVADAKVPLAVETIAGKKYFGPIVNPAGTNLALYSSDATNAAWVKTGCTAALALGGLEHDADWRGTDYGQSFTLYGATAARTGTPVGDMTFDDGVLTINRGASGECVAWQDGVIPSDTIILFEFRVVSGTVTYATGVTQAQASAGTYSFVYRASTGVRFWPAGYNSTAVIDNIIIQVVDAHTLITATGNNATALQSITSTSGERVTKWWVSTDDTDVFVSHGAPTGSELVTNGGFDANTDWTKGTGWAISGGVATHSAGTSSAIVQDVGVEPYKIHRCIVTVTGRTSGSLYWRIGNQTNVGIMSSNSTFVQYLIAGSEDTEIELFADATFDGSIDNVSVQKVAETELTPGANPVAVDLAAYTGANPQLGIRIATSGDSVRLYGVQHQMAARALRPRIGPTAGSTVTTGARTLSRTLSVAPPAISLSLVVPWSGISDTFLVQVDDGTLNNRIAVLVDNLGAGVAKLRAVKSGSLTDRTISGVLTPGDAIMFDIEWTATHIRGRVNGGAWGDITHTTIPTFTTMTLGNVTGFNVQWRRPILAFRDNLGNLLSAAPYGWNTRLLDNWS